jgi:hypothetical protein
MLFNHRLLFEMKSTSTILGTSFRTYYPCVDHDGFDVIFGDAFNLGKIQLQSVT